MEYQKIVGRYPTCRAALLPTLWIAQRESGWTSSTEESVAPPLELEPAQVSTTVSLLFDVSSAASQRFHLEVCMKLSCCRLRGADHAVEGDSRRLGVRPGETIGDGKCTLAAVERMASCTIAPLLQLNRDRLYGNLTEARS
jgi:NADH-quinone oxidoreductase subunit E